MIYIVAKYPFLDKGHYWTFDGYLREALFNVHLNYTYLNQDAKKAQLEDKIKFNPSLSVYVTIDCDEDYFRNCIDYIKKDAVMRGYDRVVLCFPWIPQFTYKELLEFEFLEDIIPVSYVGLTTLNSLSLVGKDSESRYIHQDFFSNKSKKLLWVSDIESKINDNASYIKAFPDFAESNYLNINEPEFDLAFFGLLTPYRGLFEIFILGLFNPKLKIKIKGYGYSKHRIFRPWKSNFFRYSSWRSNPIFAIVFSSFSVLASALKYLPNIEFSDQPFESEFELDKAIANTKFIFYCPKLPHGSGLTNKALSRGTPVLWNGWEGRAFNLLKEHYPEGHFKLHEIFIPGAITRKLETLPSFSGIEELMRKRFYDAVSEIKLIY